MAVTQYASAYELPAAESDGVVQFDANFLVDKSVDVKRFERANAVVPGTYTVDIVVNGQQVERKEVQFVGDSDGRNAQPCMTLALLEGIGVDVRGFVSTDASPPADQTTSQQCVNLTRQIPDATVHYDAAEQLLSFSIPQVAMKHAVRGEVDPSRWSDGVPAGLLNYDANVYRTNGGGYSNTTGYLGLMGGINLGGWRFRQRSSLSYDERTGTRFQPIDAYVQHDLTRWKSTLTLGDSTTRGDVFDSFPLRGVQMGSDDRMYPYSMRNFAPVVHGVARSNAKVEVRQNGLLIYQVTVPPGAFTLSDFSPAGYGGDLQVTVTEADGSRQTFIVPYASVPQLLPAGRNRYSVAAGRYRRWNGGADPMVGQLICQRGINNLMTGYAGALGSEGYGAALLGIALNTSWGALALDVTTARTSLPGHISSTGQSWRLTYAKTLPQTNTRLNVAAYRYSSSGYYSLSDAMQARAPSDRGWYGYSYRARNQMRLIINQDVGNGGSLFAQASVADYWGRNNRNVEFQAGYTGQMRWGTYRVSLQRTRDINGAQNNQIYASVSMPFGGRIDRRPLFSNVDMSVTQDMGGGTSVQTNATGTAGTNAAWSYGINASYNNRLGSASSLGGYGSYNGSRGYRSAFASVNGNSQQFSLSASGSAIVHPGGVTFGQAIGPNDAVGLVDAQGAGGAAVINATGVIVNRAGYAVVPYLTPYQVNTLELDPGDLSDDVELESTSQDVVPRAGAVVASKFATKRGVPLVLQVRKDNGSVVPMGADVFDARGQQVGMVGQSGMVFVRGVPDRGTLTVRADIGENGQCSFEYQRTNGNAGNATSCAHSTHLGLDDQSPREQSHNEARHATAEPTPIL